MRDPKDCKHETFIGNSKTMQVFCADCRKSRVDIEMENFEVLQRDNQTMRLALGNIAVVGPKSSIKAINFIAQQALDSLELKP